MRQNIIVGMLAGLLAATSAQAALTVGFSPVGNSAVVGGALSYDVRISDLGADILSAFDITVSYNTSILGLSSVVYGTGLNLGMLADSLQIDSGTVNVTETSFVSDAMLMSSQANDFVLFTLNFTGLTAGFTNLGLTLTSLGGEQTLDPFGQPITTALQAGIVDGSATIRLNGGGQVPEPASYGLAGLALLGLAATRRRR